MLGGSMLSQPSIHSDIDKCHWGTRNFQCYIDYQLCNLLQCLVGNSMLTLKRLASRAPHHINELASLPRNSECFTRFTSFHGVDMSLEDIWLPLYHTILYNTILYYIILYSTILYHTILYYTILYVTMQAASSSYKYFVRKNKLSSLS